MLFNNQLVLPASENNCLSPLYKSTPGFLPHELHQGVPQERNLNKPNSFLISFSLYPLNICEAQRIKNNVKKVQEVKEKRCCFSIFLEKNLYIYMYIFRASQLPLVLKNLPANAGDLREAALIG